MASAAASRSTDGTARREVTGGGGPGAVVLATPTLAIEGVVPAAQNPPVCVGAPDDVCVREGGSVGFKVTLSSGTGGHATDIYVDYRTFAITAKPGTDYVEKMTFAPGIHTLTHTPLKFPATTSATPQTLNIAIAAVNDQTYEDHYKSFGVEIFNPTEGTIARSEGGGAGSRTRTPRTPTGPTGRRSRSTASR